MTDQMSAAEKRALIQSLQERALGNAATLSLKALRHSLDSYWHQEAARCIYRDDERQIFLLQVPGLVPSNDSDYLLSIQGSFVIVRNVGGISNKFSFQECPPEFEHRRNELQELFRRAVRSVDLRFGWYRDSPWETLSEEERTECSPVYLSDNVTSPSVY